MHVHGALASLGFRQARGTKLPSDVGVAVYQRLLHPETFETRKLAIVTRALDKGELWCLKRQSCIRLQQNRPVLAFLEIREDAKATTSAKRHTPSFGSMWGITLAGYVLMPAAWALDADVRNQSGGIDMGPDPQCPFLPVSNRYFPKGIAYCFLEMGLCYPFLSACGAVPFQHTDLQKRFASHGRSS